MRTVLASLALLFIAGPLVTPLAAADPTATPDVKAMNTSDCARARKQNKTCVLDMGKEDVDGAVPKHDEINVSIIGFGRSSSLIHIRKDFIQEILRSAEDIE